MTLRTYAHFLDVADRDAAAVMGDVAAALGYEASADAAGLASAGRSPAVTA